ncbi:MAG TPA: SDR family oxidoreductase [Myxococcaceae bacterium]|nr:SDR family oxidoreductase [Myxococcaceae bacterium]
MRAFVTGGTGLLGSSLVRVLLSEGHAVRALARSRDKAMQLLGDTRAEVVVGDLLDVPAFASSLDGCDVLFHTAAYFREYYRPGADHWPQLERVNVRGTLELAEAAREHGVRRLIDTSTSGIIGLQPGGDAGDESTPPAPVVRSNLYFKSKLLVEERLRAYSAGSGLDVVSVLPGWMFGPGDAAPTAAGQFVLDFLARKIPAFPPGGVNVVDARDVAMGMVRAAAKGRSGERYILGGDYLTLADILVELERVSGVPAPRVTVPYPVALGIAAVAQTWARLTRTETVMSVEGVRTLQAGLRVTSLKAQHELGATFRPFDETLRDTVAWLRSRKQVAAAAA